VNSDLESTFNTLRTILEAERERRDRQPDLPDLVRNLNREFDER
jgi:guanylate kinase